MTVLLERAIGVGDSQVSYGSGERPRYSALARTIDQFYADLQPPLADLREAVFSTTQLPQIDAVAPTKEDAKHAAQLVKDGRHLAPTHPVVVKAEEPFRFGAKMRRVIDRAINIFLDTIAGPDRSRKGYVNGGAESDTPDGILQQRQILAYSVGLRRASDLVGAAQTLVPTRQDPAVKEMLESAFQRLSQSGTLRLEGVRDEIHGILVSGTDAGLSPLEVGRSLSKQFSQYSGYEFSRLARTEAAFAAVAGNREQMAEFGVLYVQWLLASGACPICQSYEGKLIPIDAVSDHPPAHPQCCCDLSPYTGGLA